MGDDPRIPLATDEVMGPEAKRKKEDAEDPRAPKDTKKEAGACVPRGGQKQSLMSVRSSIDFGHAHLQEISLYEQAFL